MIREHKSKLFGLLFTAGLILSSCGDDALFDRSYSFEKHQWEQGNKPRFTVYIPDTTSRYDVTFTLRTTTDYPFSNIWMNVSMIFPDGKKLRRPYELKITDDKGWLGKKYGSVIENELVFPKSILPLKGKYVFVLEQATPEATVDQVLDIGLRVNKAQK